MDFSLKLLNRNHGDRPRVNPLHTIINWLNETVDLGSFCWCDDRFIVRNETYQKSKNLALATRPAPTGPIRYIRVYFVWRCSVFGYSLRNASSCNARIILKILNWIDWQCDLLYIRLSSCTSKCPCQ